MAMVMVMAMVMSTNHYSCWICWGCRTDYPSNRFAFPDININDEFKHKSLCVHAQSHITGDVTCVHMSVCVCMCDISRMNDSE